MKFVYTTSEAKRKFGDISFGVVYLSNKPFHFGDKALGSRKDIFWDRTGNMAPLGYLNYIEMFGCKEVSLTIDDGGRLSDGYYNVLTFSAKGKFPHAQYLTFITCQRMKMMRTGPVVKDYVYPNKKTVGI